MLSMVTSKLQFPWSLIKPYSLLVFHTAVNTDNSLFDLRVNIWIGGFQSLRGDKTLLIMLIKYLNCYSNVTAKFKLLCRR